jgi:hypothetical protein
MDANRLILETDGLGNLKQVPKLPPNKQLEVIVLGDSISQPIKPRQPHPDIAGKGKLLGDIINSVPETDWNFPQ